MADFDLRRPLADIYRHRAAAMPNAMAQVFDGRKTTYGELDRRASRVAQGLIAEGCRPDSRIGFMGKNSDLYFELLGGSLKAKNAIVGVNWRLAGPEAAYVLNDSKTEILFVGAEFYELVASIRAEVPGLRKIIAMDGGHADWPAFESWRDSFPDTDPLLEHAPDDDIIQLYTSGTTGHPKGVQLTNANYSSIAEQAAQSWAEWAPGSVNFVCMPLFHVAGVNVGVLGLLNGLENIVLKDVDPGEILRLIEAHRINIAFMVPAVILFLLHHPDIKKTDLSSLTQVLYGASPIAEDLLLEAQKVFGCDFIQVYGLTETTGGATHLLPEDHAPERGKLRSCGKPNPGVEIRTVDAEGTPTGVGEVGEIVMRSECVMKGYWNRPEATAEAIRDGWFYTGDAGYFDDEGFLYIHDRVKDMIVSGGENVYPAEVENALFGHAAVADVAVIGVPDEKWGEAVKAVVVRGPGSDVTAEDIISYAKTQIAGYKVPKSIDFIEALPRNPTGKVLRRQLREPYWKGRDRNVS